LCSIRYFSVQPGWGQSPPPSPFVRNKQPSIRSHFSTLNIHQHPFTKSQLANPIFNAFRPSLQVPRSSPRLAASLSTAAQQILDSQSTAPVEWDSSAAATAASGLAEYGEMAQHGLGITYWPSDIMIRLLEFCHVSTQLPWWGSIILLTVILRVALFPLMLKTTRNISVLPYIADKQKALMEETKKARLSGELVEMRKATMKLLALYKQWGYSPFMSFWGILQIPIFFAVFRTCSRCSNLPVPGWETGGTAWFMDLTVIDPYFILPTISGVTTAVTIWVCPPNCGDMG